jgi:hypothetical protein
MKNSDKLRDMETPMVLGVELDRTTLTPLRRPIRNTPAPEPTRFFVPPPDFPIDPAPASGLLSDIRSLSSGTLSTLTKVSNYEKLEGVREQFVLFYLTAYNPSWENWMDVWVAFCG